jgi:uncharacterized protein (TIGR02246 family)
MIGNSKKWILLFAWAMISANTAVAQKALHKPVQSADQFMQTFMQTYENHDLKKLVSFYAPNAVVIGTGKDEIAYGRAKIAASFKRDFAESQNVQVKMKRISVQTQSNMAVASYLLAVNVKMPHSAPFHSNMRFTATLLKENNNWMILQSHLSAPLTTQKIGESYPKTAMTDPNREFIIRA